MIKNYDEGMLEEIQEAIDNGDITVSWDVVDGVRRFILKDEFKDFDKPKPLSQILTKCPRCRYTFFVTDEQVQEGREREAKDLMRDELVIGEKS